LVKLTRTVKFFKKDFVTVCRTQYIGLLITPALPAQQHPCRGWFQAEQL